MVSIDYYCKIVLSTPFVEPFVGQFLKTMIKVQVLDIASTKRFL